MGVFVKFDWETCGECSVKLLLHIPKGLYSLQINKCYHIIKIYANSSFKVKIKTVLLLSYQLLVNNITLCALC